VSVSEHTEKGVTSYQRPEQSDSDGRVALNGLPPGVAVDITFKSEGFLSATSAPLTGMPGELFPEEQIVLHRLASMVAVLSGPNGELLADTEVAVIVLETDGGAGELDVRTDGAGVLRLRDVLPATEVVLEIVVGSGIGSEMLGTRQGPIVLEAQNEIDFGDLTLDVTWE
jgi:hypothetical protein